MNILVTGAEGFVGSTLIKALLDDRKAHWGVFGTKRHEHDRTNTILTAEERRRVHFFEMDLTRPDSMAPVFQQTFDRVVHLAGISRANHAEEKPEQAWETNVSGTASLLRMMGAAGQKPTTLIVSSLEVYGEGDGVPFGEDRPPSPISVYARTKEAAESAAFRLAEEHDIPVIVARPGIHTGPKQPEGLIPGWMTKIKEGRTEITFADPDGVRELLDVRDVVQAYLLLLEKGRPGQVYNVASGNGLTFSEILDTLAKEMSSRARLVKGGQSRGWDAKYSVGSGRKLVADTTWTPEYEIARTFRDMVHAQTN